MKSHIQLCLFDDIDDERWELIDGIAYLKDRSELMVHQEISGSLSFQLWRFMEDKPGKVFFGPLDVRLNADGPDDTVVLPDILVVCDKSKLESGHGCVFLCGGAASPV